MEKEQKEVPYIFYESAVFHMERTIRRLWILCIVLLVTLAGSNLAWIIYENQFEDIVVTQETEEGGSNNYIGEDGDITINGD